MKNSAEKIQDFKKTIESEMANLDRMQDGEASENFLSVNACRLNIDSLKAKIRILENDGYAYFSTLTDLEGNIVSEKIVNTKYGKAFIIQDEDGSVKFVNGNVKENTLTKKGYKIEMKLYKAWVTISGNSIVTFKSDNE